MDTGQLSTPTGKPQPGSAPRRHARNRGAAALSKGVRPLQCDSPRCAAAPQCAPLQGALLLQCDSPRCAAAPQCAPLQCVFLLQCAHLQCASAHWQRALVQGVPPLPCGLSLHAALQHAAVLHVSLRHAGQLALWPLCALHPVHDQPSQPEGLRRQTDEFSAETTTPPGSSRIQGEPRYCHLQTRQSSASYHPVLSQQRSHPWYGTLLACCSAIRAPSCQHKLLNWLHRRQ
mmetsp:Transcript_55005/g.119971  ORF Transcript_55005/g.119971 Transcript_55005/m.119971 type:complete len:231 (-) Transcript_55005:109-801(-)